MHKGFADWYRVVSIEPRADDLANRWAGVEAFAGKASGHEIADLLRLFFGLRQRDPAFLDRFRTTFKDADAAFPMRDNSAELAVLAGASLVHLFSSDRTRANAASLGVCCAACQGFRQPAVPEITVLASEHLTHTSQGLRTTGPADAPETTQCDTSAKINEIRTALQGNAATTAAEPLATTLKHFETSLNALSRWAEAVTACQLLRQEDSDILWWVFGEHSRDLGAHFNTLNVAGTCIVSGKELADLVRVLPGPFAARAFLDKILSLSAPQTSASVTLADAVAGCPAPWREEQARCVELDDHDDLCPVWLALRRATEVDNNDSWQAGFAKYTSVQPTQPLDPRDLAVQVYEERLFSKATASIGPE